MDVQGDEAIQSYKKGDSVKAKVLEVDVDKERVYLASNSLLKILWAKHWPISRKAMLSPVPFPMSPMVGWKSALAIT